MIVPHNADVTGKFDSDTRALIEEHRRHTQAYDYDAQQWTMADHVHVSIDTDRGRLIVHGCGALLATCEPYLKPATSV